MAKMGRPRIEIDKEQFEKLCAIQCTLDEIASWFRCSVDTIDRWCQRTYGVTFAGANKMLSQLGITSLRRAQFKMAQTNASMAIWLGKQYLGQRDQEQERRAEDRINLNIQIQDCNKNDQ